ncbi:50S ribosomal subunit protein L31 (modular protein) [Vibrio tapetis subsp. tapetis]|uniref:Large ribosomal subunit protein bL31 n=2 Tax=Vibrio tapetis TaxID=52443 RepID=A0A2N8ZFX9_9VIBR|nr:50S ribosomal subunit protein L31 (modular protein) [Vibrio tapetis subsp. tapetis]
MCTYASTILKPRVVSGLDSDSDTAYIKVIPMKTGIHPEYKAVSATCSCGNTFEFNSTLAKESIHLDVCDKCHPFYTGKQRVVDTGGRVDRFNKRFGALSSK